MGGDGGREESDRVMSSKDKEKGDRECVKHGASRMVAGEERATEKQVIHAGSNTLDVDD